MFWRKAGLVVGVSVLGAAASAASGGALAPVVGGWIGTAFMGLRGAAATSAGLAWLGGGSIASGGAGMAGGAALVTKAVMAVGATAAGSVTKKAVDGIAKECPGCHELLRPNARFCDNCGRAV